MTWCKPGELKAMQDTDLAYLAGIIDGEGCLGAHLINKARNPYGGNVSFKLAIDNCSICLIEKIQSYYEEMNLKYHMEIGRIRPNSTKQAHRIVIYSMYDIAKLLRAIYPYMISKKKEAELMIGWIAKWKSAKNGNRYSFPKPSTIERYTIVQLLKEAKKCA